MRHAGRDPEQQRRRRLLKRRAEEGHDDQRADRRERRAGRAVPRGRGPPRGRQRLREDEKDEEGENDPSGDTGLGGEFEKGVARMDRLVAERERGSSRTLPRHLQERVPPAARTHPERVQADE